MRLHQRTGSPPATHFAVAAALVIAASIPARGETAAPTDATVPVPEVTVETGVEGYRAFAEVPIKEWNAALREAYEGAVEMGLPGTYATPRPAGSTPPAAGAGHGHGQHQ